MFTGIIQEIGMLNKKSIQSRTGVCSFFILTKKLKPRLGDSVAVQGICLTVRSKEKAGFWVDLVPETQKRSSLKDLEIGRKVNLEPSIRAGETFDGHFVMGHVDDTGRVEEVKKDNRGNFLTISFLKKLKPFIAEKGSITIDGVSLTIIEAKNLTCTVALIPYTISHTTLGSRKKGDLVSIEVDMIARYLYNFTRK